MDKLPIVLFLLGVIFLFLGWRWQSPANDEAMTALKGLAYLKREIIRVQDQVRTLENKLQTQQIELKEPVPREEPSEIERKENSKLYCLKTKEQGKKTSGGRVEPHHNSSLKYQEVLELAAKGECIPAIAQQLLISQDAVLMVLQIQPKGAGL